MRPKKIKLSKQLEQQYDLLCYSEVCVKSNFIVDAIVLFNPYHAYICLFCLVSGIGGGLTASKEKQLIKQLIQQYERQGRQGRPVANHNENIMVNFSLSLIQIMDIDEKNQVLKTNVWYHYVSIVLFSLLISKVLKLASLIKLVFFGRKINVNDAGAQL